MNKNRKARFNDVVSFLESAKDELADIQSEEQDAFDALPEGLQISAKGDNMQEYINLIDDTMSKIDCVISFIDSHIINKK